MKNLQNHAFNASRCRLEWNDFDTLMSTKPTLDERADILPFFKTNKNLSLLISTYIPNIKNPSLIGSEYQIDNNFVADLIIGDPQVHRYLLVEFENGTADGVFKQKGKKATRDWASRFEGAYSQIVDWIWKLEDLRSTSDFTSVFGSPRAIFQGIIIIGKDMVLSPQEKDRLKWRMDKTMIDSNAVSCVSFNELKDDFDHWLTTYYNV